MTKLNQVKAILAGMATLLGQGRGTVSYLACPITSGPRLVAWHVQHGEAPKNLREDIIQPNIAAARELVWRSRCKEPHHLVIDPTELSLPSWTQEDYRSLWSTVITDLVDQVIFMDGWEYSNGCASEMLAAINSGKLILSEQGSVLTYSSAIRKVNMARTTLKRLGLDVSVHDMVLCSYKGPKDRMPGVSRSDCGWLPCLMTADGSCANRKCKYAAPSVCEC